MKKIFFISIISLGFFNLSKAQTSEDSVYVYKGFLGYKYIQHDAMLNLNQLPDILNENQQAYILIGKAKTNHTIAAITSGTGALILGWQLITALAGGEHNWTVAALGGGLVLVSIPFYTKSKSQSLEAVDLYNAGLGTESRKFMLNVGYCHYGIGLSLHF